MKPGLIMKFGGTSLGTPESIARSARHVAREERVPIVVASAVGGVTDLLIACGEAARNGEGFEGILAKIEEKHNRIAEAADIGESALGWIEEELVRLLNGVAMLGELSPRVRDTLLSFGERISVHLLAAELRRIGCPARPVMSWDLGMITDDGYGKAEPVFDVDERIRNAVEELDKGEIPVVTGFIGHDEDGRITTLGRGGSDFTAALYGAAMGVEEIQIWTDVPGILRADPKVVTDADVVPELTFEEAAELAFFGAKVLHPKTMEPARVAGIPVRVLGTFQVDPDSKESVGTRGTLIHDKAPEEPFRAMALQKEVQSLHISSLRMLEAPGFLSQVFEILAKYSVSVDVIATSEVSISMTLDLYEGDVDAAVGEISTFARVQRDSGRSILCMVGAGFRKSTDLMARVLTLLAEEGVPVHVISQGASRINITIVTEPPHGQNAMKRLHNGLFN